MLTLLLLASCAKKLDYFHTALFQPLRDGGLYPVEIGLEEQGLTLSGYGYFNNDKYCDAMVVNKDKNEVYVYLWDQNNLRFDYNKILQAKIDGVIE